MIDMWEWRFFSNKIEDFETMEERLKLPLSPISFETRTDNYFDLNLKRYGLKERNKQSRRNVVFELKSLIKEEDQCEYWVKWFRKHLPLSRYDITEVLASIQGSLSNAKALADVQAVMKAMEYQKIREILLYKDRRKFMVMDTVNLEFEKTKIEYNNSSWYTCSLESTNLNSVKKCIPRFLDFDKKVMAYPEFISTLP